VLEAMAAGLPVITTSLVNQGLGAEDGQEIILADDPDLMAARIVDLLRNADLRQSIGLAGREFVTHKFRWENVNQRISEIEANLFH
jgi:glycosyltransferase involved in cell wall biosynthesis